MTTAFHASAYGRFTEIESNLRRKQLQRMSQSSNLLGGSFSNSNDVRAQLNLEEKVNPSTLKEDFFLENRPIHFHINIISAVRPIKGNKLSFSSIEINKPPVHFVL